MKRFATSLFGLLLSASLLLGQVVVNGSGEVVLADNGIPPNGPDCTVALQNLVSTVPIGAKLRFGLGKYLLSAPIILDWNVNGKPTPNGGLNTNIFLQGVGRGTEVTGNFSGPLFSLNTGDLDNSRTITIQDFNLSNAHATGSGIELNRVDRSGIYRVFVSRFGKYGIAVNQAPLSATALDFRLEDCECRTGVSTAPIGSYGFKINVGRGVATNCSAYQCDVGGEFARNMLIDGFSGEVNNIALRLGGKGQGNCGVNRVTLENNKVAPVEVSKNTFKTTITGLTILGTGNPQYGVWCRDSCGGLNLTDANITGGFSVAALRLGNTNVTAGYAASVVLTNNAIFNGNPAGVRISSIVPAGQVTAIQTVYP